ncbi:MAG TPA: PH domain-containing protein [Xanthomonadales bacterium]|nr:PH domain-containing protein [Xanthomonadales bacterium]
MENVLPQTVESFDAATMAGDVFPLHPNIHKVWRWQALLFALAASLPGTLIAIATSRWWLLAVIVLAAVLLVRLSGGWRARYAAQFRCVLLPDGLLVRRGAWWRKESFVPRARIQHTDVDEGPIARRYGIATLKVFTAGSSVSELEVEGLPRADAIALRDRLLGRSGADGV